MAHSGGSRISPRRGRQLPGGGRQHTNLSNFPKNCMKLKEFGPPGGAHVPCAPKRMHSSRMRTACTLTVSPSMLCSRGGVWSRGVVSQHALRQTPPPWTEFLTHASENITLPQTSFAGGKKVKIPRQSNPNNPLPTDKIFLNSYVFVKMLAKLSPTPGESPLPTENIQNRGISDSIKRNVNCSM